MNLAYNTINNKEEIIYDGKIDKLCQYTSYLLKQSDNRLYINFKGKNLQNNI